MRKLAILGLLWTQTAAADEVRIATPADAEQVCDLLGGDEAGGKVFVAELPATAFRLTPWDRTRGELGIDQSDGFRSPAGLELIEGGLVATATAPRLPMRIPATAEESMQLVALHKGGALSLDVWFRPIKDGPACARVHRGHASGVRFAIVPIAFAVRQGSRIVVRGETPEYAALHEAEQPVVEPVVAVSPALLAKGGLAPAKVTRAAMALAPALTECYRAGLAEDPMLRGSLVAGIVVDKNGHVSDARLELDALGVPAATRCALRSFRAGKFPPGAGAVSVPVKFAGR